MMKRFKFLGAFFVGLISLVGFGYCNYFVNIQTATLSSNGGTRSFNQGDCVMITSAGCQSASEFYNNSNVYLGTLNGLNTYSFFCFSEAGYGKNTYTQSCTWRYGNLTGLSVSCPTCEEQYTSEECQQEYSLMPISSCNSEYCGLNGLCPAYTGSTMSELYINGINHLGAPIINISIPLEQSWDYEYTGDVMNINLSGENNVDYEYIDNIIRTQNSKPNDTDFNNIISGLVPLFVPGLVLILFILFVFRFIKKIF